MNVFLVFIIGSLLVSYTALRYGFLPGKDFSYIENKDLGGLEGHSFNFEFIDSRPDITSISSFKGSLDRETELEGIKGFDFFQTFFIKAILEAGGTIDNRKEKILIHLNAISFSLTGFIKITVHGVVDFSTTSNVIQKTYSVNMKDGDNDAPLGKNSFATRKTASRLMVSGALRRAMNLYIRDL